MLTLGLASAKLFIQVDGTDITFGGVKCQRGPVRFYCIALCMGMQ